jgi:hypothetical protein
MDVVRGLWSKYNGCNAIEEEEDTNRAQAI